MSDSGNTSRDIDREERARREQPYTLSINDLRDYYIRAGALDKDAWPYQEERGAEFDQALAEHDREVAQGALAALEWETLAGYIHEASNDGETPPTYEMSWGAAGYYARAVLDGIRCEPSPAGVDPEASRG